MATAYSGEVAVGSYNRIRLRVEYSGTSATCYMEFRRTSSYTGSWADSQASITFNGTTKSAPYSYSGTVGTSWVQLCSAGGFSVSTSGGTYNWTFNNPGGSSVLGCSGSITISSQVSPPTGLSFTGCTAGPDWYDIGVSISGWGTGGSSSQRYIEAQVWTRNDTSLVEPRRFQAQYGVTSATIRVNNSSSGSLTITPNTIYTVGIYATNGAAAAGSTRVGNHCSAPPVMTSTVNSTTTDSAVLGWSFGNQGGAYSLILEYSLDGSNWNTMSTQTGSGSKSGTYTITGLSPATTYSVRTRIRTTNTSQSYYITDGNTVSVTTQSAVKLYGRNPSPNLSSIASYSSAIWWASNKTDFLAIINSLPAGTYTVSATYKLVTRNDTSDASVCGFRIGWNSGSTSTNKFTSWGSKTVGDTIRASFTFTITSALAGTYSNWWFYGCGIDGTGSTGSATISEIQLQTGSSATSYQPYTGVQGTRRIVKLYGKNPSKNLFDKSATAVATASNSIQKTELDTGIQLKWTGSSSTGVNSFLWNVFKIIDTQQIVGQKVSLKFNVEGHSTSGKFCAYLGLCDANGGTRQSKVVQSIDADGEYTVTWNSATYDSTRPYLCVVFYVTYGNGINVSTGDYVKYTNIMLNTGDASSYTPYYGPQGTITIKKLYGKNPSKNLFDKSSGVVKRSGDVTAVPISTGVQTTNESTSVGNADFVLYDIGNASDYNGKTITISYTATASSTNTPKAIIGLASSDYSSRSSKVQQGGTGYNTVQWTVESNASYPRLVMWLYNNAGTAISGTTAGAVRVDYTNLMVEVGSSATSYTPYLGPQGTKLIYEE